jgi:uridylate kinase
VPKKPRIIISLGGSILVPGPQAKDANAPTWVDQGFLSRFTLLVHELTQTGYRFVITVGGGKVNSHYVNVLRQMHVGSDLLLDTVGIASTHFNAALLWAALSPNKLVYRQIMANPTMPIRTTKPVIVGGGWKPGCSTDKDAVLWAITTGADTIINASNIEYVYDKDPRQFDDAQRIVEINWTDFRKIVGTKWEARMSAPFDPIAASLAQKHNLKVLVLNGRDIPNLRAAIQGQHFIGTTIS